MRVLNRRKRRNKQVHASNTLNEVNDIKTTFIWSVINNIKTFKGKPISLFP